MNAGNKQRGQADGFLIEGLGKAKNIKDIDGNSILQVIVTKLV
jgi:hypothetical protein